MENKKKTPWRLLVALFAIHFVVSLIFILISSTTHPLLAYVKELPLAVQIITSSLFGIILYIIPGYLLIVSQQDNEDWIRFVDRLMLLFSLIILILFVVSFIYVELSYSKQGWLVYAMANPISGMLIYNLFDTSASWWDLFWGFSAFVPAIGMMIGMYLRLKREGAVR